MSLFQCLFFVRKRFFRNKFLLLLGLFVSTTSLTVFFCSFLWSQALSFGKKQIESGLSFHMNNYGFMRMSDETFELDGCNSIAERLSDFEEVAAAGYYIAYTILFKDEANMEGWKEIQRIQYDNDKAYEPQPGKERGIQVIEMDETLVPMFQLPMIAGEMKPEGSSDTLFVFLGYNFKDIPIGTELKKTSNGQNVVVAGILEKGSRILDPNYVVYNDAQTIFRYTTLLDNMVIMVTPKSHQYFQAASIMFSSASGYTYEQTTRKIKDFLEGEGVYAEAESLPHRLNVTMHKEDWAGKYTGKIAFLLGLLSVFFMMATQLFLMVRRKEEIGVWVTSGIDKKTIAKILVLETFLKMCISFGLAFELSWGLCRLRLFDKAYFKEIKGELFWTYFVLCLLLVLFMTAIISSVPIYFLTKRSLCSLVKGEWEENRRIRFFREGGILFGVLLASFITAFWVVYFGIDLFRQEKEITKERELAYYEEYYMYNGLALEQVDSVQKIPEMNFYKGNIYIQLYTQVGENQMSGFPVQILMLKNEELKETIYYLDKDEGKLCEEALCVIGALYEQEVYQEKGNLYIDVRGIKCRIVGRFAQTTFAGEDNRLLIFGESLSEEEMNRLCFSGEYNQIRTVYKKAKHEETGELDSFREWTFSILDRKNTLLYQEEPYYKVKYDEVGFYEIFMPVLKKIVYAMLIVAFCCCAIVAVLWGSMHRYEMMVKRTLGYSKDKLIFEVAGHFFLYELVSCLVTIVVSFVSELVCEKSLIWIVNVKSGFGFCLIVMVVFGVLLSLLPLKVIERQMPANILKNMD